MSLRLTFPVLWRGGRRCMPGFTCHNKCVFLSSISLHCRPPTPSSWSLIPVSSHLSSTTRRYSTPARAPRVQESNANINPVAGKKRVQRKKPGVNRDPGTGEPSAAESQIYKVVAYSTAEEYDLEAALLALKRHSRFRLLSLPDDVDDVLYVSLPIDADSTGPSAPHEVLLFREGTAVFWNVPPAVCSRFLHFLTAFEEGCYDADTIANESEVLDYSYCQQRGARLSSGRVLLDQPHTGTNTSSSSPASVTSLQMYAFSNALSLSVKLGTWEACLQRYIESMSHVTEELQRGEAIRMRRQEVLRKNGELFSLRHAINLSSDCLDTPDFYWDREHLERLYRQTCVHLNIGKRTRVMNEKLNHCVELAGMLASNLQDKHHVRLEWMIIALIMVEVGFELIHFIER